MFENIASHTNFILSAVLLGTGATIIMDIWALLLKVVFNIPSLNYALVGRWLGYMPKGQFLHDNINTSSPIKGEAVIGWTAHYLIGVIFAAVLLLLMGLSWLESPDPIPALVTGVLTVVFPYLVMLPGFGMGVAASKVENAHVAQFKSLMAHTAFGVGLYTSAILANWIF